MLFAVDIRDDVLLGGAERPGHRVVVVIQALLAEHPGLEILAAPVEDLALDDRGHCTGVVTAAGETLGAGAVVLTTGTFLRGVIHRGEEQIPAGRVGEAPAIGLAATLARFDFAVGAYDARLDDGLSLMDCRITNAVRCVPPENKPTSREVKTCGAFLQLELAGMLRLRIVLALGLIAHGAVLATLGLKRSQWPFTHGAMHVLPKGLILADSYHCSRYNTNTGKLTESMFDEVFRAIREQLGPTDC